MYPKALKSNKVVALRCMALLISVSASFPTTAQTPAASYVSMSQAVAEQFGKAWKRGELCKVSLDGLSRRSAGLLFSKRLDDPQLGRVMASYDEAVRLASGERCERKLLAQDVQRADAALRRYLQVPAPYRLEIGRSQPAQY